MSSEQRGGAVPLSRAQSGRWLGGVCAGLAPLRGLSVGWMRIGFVLLGLLGGIGVAVYLACWLIIPVAATDTGADPGAAGPPRGVVAVAQACAACVGLMVLAGGAAIATLFGLGWLVVLLAAAVLAGVFAGRRRLGPAWALLPIAALTLPAVAVAASGLRLAPQAGQTVVAPGTSAQLQSTVYRSGLGEMLIDLRGTSFPATGTVNLRIRAGVKRTIVALPAGECVHVNLHYQVNPFLVGLGALLTGRSTLPYSAVDVFGRLYTPRTGTVIDQGLGAYPTLNIDFSSEGGSLYVRDYPNTVNPNIEPDWPGYIGKPEARPNLHGEPRKIWPMMLRAWRQRLRTEIASDRSVDELMPGPCG
jgi:phage shock protein PspC (stress-responsive transcriptional regulator)